MSLRTIIGLIFLLLSINAHAADITYQGKVIDADTKEPIEGAVVVAVWDEERATPAGPTSRLKDVKETLTDKNGMWLIKGPKGGEVGNIKAGFSFLTGTYFTTPPVFIVFKPGYCSWPKGFEIDPCKGKIKSESVADEEIFELPMLPKLTNRKDRLRNIPNPEAGINDKRIPMFSKLAIIDNTDQWYKIALPVDWMSGTSRIEKKYTATYCLTRHVMSFEGTIDITTILPLPPTQTIETAVHEYHNNIPEQIIEEVRKIRGNSANDSLQFQKIKSGQMVIDGIPTEWFEFTITSSKSHINISGMVYTLHKNDKYHVIITYTDQPTYKATLESTVNNLKFE